MIRHTKFVGRYRPMTGREKRTLYRKLALARRDVDALLAATSTSVERGNLHDAEFEAVHPVDMVRTTSIMIQILEAMRTEYAYRAGESGVGYPEIGAAAGMSRQAARKQWPGAVAAGRRDGGENGPCPLAQHLDRTGGIPAIACSPTALRSSYKVDFAIAPAAVRIPGCDAHIGLYQRLLTDEALADMDGVERPPDEYAQVKDGVQRFLREAAYRGDLLALRQLAWLVESQGEQADYLLSAAAGRGDQGAAYELASRLTLEGKTEQAKRIWKTYATRGDYLALTELAELGDAREAAELWRQDAEKGDEHALNQYLAAMAASGSLKDAASVVQKAYTRWSLGLWAQERLDSIHLFIDLLIENGRNKEAESWLRSLAGSGEHSAVRELAWRLERAGDVDNAEWWLRFALARYPGGDTTPRTASRERRAGVSSRVPATLQALHDLLMRQQRVADAEAVLREAADGGDAGARTALMLKLAPEERRSKLERFAHAVLAPGTPSKTAEQKDDLEERRAEIRDVARGLEADGDWESAAVLWRVAADHGDFLARRALVQALERLGRGDEAEAWLNDLIEEPRRLRASRSLYGPPGGDPKEVSARQATRVLAGLRERRGDVEGAMILLRRIADQGDRMARKDLRELLRRHPLLTTATIVEAAGEADGEVADPWP